MDCSTPGFPIHHQFQELAQTHVIEFSDAIQPSHPLSSPSPPAFNLASIRVFFSESVLWIRWPKYWTFSFSTFIHSFIPMNIHDWFHLDWLIWSPCNQRDSQEFSPAPSSKAPILRRSAFFMVQLLHPYMNTGKTIAFSTRTFVHKVMSLLFNMLSSLVIAFLPRSKRLLISWLQSPSAVILECEKIKSLHYFHCFPIYLPWNDGTRCHDLSFLNVEF